MLYFFHPYPMHLFVSYDNCSFDHTAFCHNISAQVEPFSLKEVAQHDCWKQAMDAELHALDRNQTWTLVPLPFGIKPIGYRRVYKLKHKPDGIVDRFKAWLWLRVLLKSRGLIILKPSPLLSNLL